MALALSTEVRKERTANSGGVIRPVNHHPMDAGRTKQLEVLLVIDVKHIADGSVAVLGHALRRRGWQAASENMFRIALKTTASDADVVKYIERDVREAEYVAGLQGLQSVCILNSPDDDFSSAELDSLLETGSDVNLS